MADQLCLTLIFWLFCWEVGGPKIRSSKIMTIAKLLGLTKDILYVEEFSHNYKFKWNYKKFSEVKYYDLTIKRFILTKLLRPKIVGSIYILTQNSKHSQSVTREINSEEILQVIKFNSEAFSFFPRWYTKNPILDELPNLFVKSVNNTPAS